MSDANQATEHRSFEVVVPGAAESEPLLRAARAPVFWWINEGVTWSRRIEHGILTAPAVPERASWASLGRMRPGDVVFFYARSRGGLYAMGTVDAVPAVVDQYKFVPAGDVPVWLVTVSGSDIEPLSTDTIHRELLGVPRYSDGPYSLIGAFDRNGNPKHGYCWQVKRSWGARLAGLAKSAQMFPISRLDERTAASPIEMWDEPNLLLRNAVGDFHIETVVPVPSSSATLVVTAVETAVREAIESATQDAQGRNLGVDAVISVEVDARPGSVVLDIVVRCLSAPEQVIASLFGIVAVVAGGLDTVDGVLGFKERIRAWRGPATPIADAETDVVVRTRYAGVTRRTEVHQPDGTVIIDVWAADEIIVESAWLSRP